MDRDRLLDEVITAYLQAAEAGLAPDHAEWLAAHPELAPDLAAFFAAQGTVERLLPPATPCPLGAPTLAHGEEPPVSPLGTVRYFGDYELLEEIGRGGMGVVYRARQLALGRVVAVKMVLAGHLASEGEVRRFRRE